MILRKKNTTPKREIFLKKALKEAQRSLNDAYAGLANVADPDLIDSYIYELNAANLRYQVILRDYKLLKKENIHCNWFNENFQTLHTNPMFHFPMQY